MGRDYTKIDHINAQSLNILCVTETWLYHKILDDHETLPHYNVYRCDKGRSGGVYIYIRDILKCNASQNRCRNDRRVEGRLGEGAVPQTSLRNCKLYVK